MSRRKYEPGAFVPCSAKHKSCSPAHAALVAGYRAERWRQEVEHEHILSNPGELALWKENGGKLIDFKQWLIANKGSGNATATQRPVPIRTHRLRETHGRSHREPRTEGRATVTSPGRPERGQGAGETRPMGNGRSGIGGNDAEVSRQTTQVRTYGQVG